MSLTVINRLRRKIPLQFIVLCPFCYGAFEVTKATNIALVSIVILRTVYISVPVRMLLFRWR